MATQKYTCCICGEEHLGYGNNPYPVKDDGCCDDCNLRYVVHERYKQSAIRAVE